MCLITKAYLRLFAEFAGFSVLAYFLITPVMAPFAVAALAAWAAFTWRSLSHAYGLIQHQEQIAQLMDAQLIQVSRFMEEYEERLPEMRENIKSLEAEMEDLKIRINS